MCTRQTERRQRVMVGDLPSDFLRIDDQDSDQISEPSSSFEPSVVTGVAVSDLRMKFPVQLCLTVQEAELKKTSSGIITMDPYIVVRFGQTSLKTHTHLRGGMKPTWNKLFQVSLPHNIRTIFFNLFDENMLIPDKCIGSSLCTLPDKLFVGGFLNVWIPIYNYKNSSKIGKLHIFAYLLPSESSDEVQASAPPPATVPMAFADSTHASASTSSSAPLLPSASAPLFPSASAPLMPSASDLVPYSYQQCVLPYAAHSLAQYGPSTFALRAPASPPPPPPPSSPCRISSSSNLPLYMTNGSYSSSMMDAPNVTGPSCVIADSTNLYPHTSAVDCIMNKDLSNFQENLQKLIEMFPNVTGSRLFSILKECNGDVSNATEKLVYMNLPGC